VFEQYSFTVNLKLHAFSHSCDGCPLSHALAIWLDMLIDAFGVIQINIPAHVIVATTTQPVMLIRYMDIWSKDACCISMDYWSMSIRELILTILYDNYEQFCI